MDYSSKLIQIKEQFHLNDMQFSDVLNVSLSEVREWQNGNNKPSEDSLYKLYDVFGITSDMLFNSRKKCCVYAMRIKLNKNFQLMDVINNYYCQWKVCALRKRMDLYVLNPIVSLLSFIFNPIETIGDAAVDGAVDRFKNKKNYVDYLLEYKGKAILINYKKGYAFIQVLHNVPMKRNFRFNGRIYKKI